MINSTIKLPTLLFTVLGIILIASGFFWLIPELQFRLLASKYRDVLPPEKSSCYSGWVSNDFNQTYESPNGYSLKYPNYFEFKKEFQKNEDQVDHSIQYVEGYLISKPGILNRLNIHLGLVSYQNTNFNPLMRSNDNNRLPCSLVSKGNYRIDTYPSLFGGELGVVTNSEIIYPVNRSNFTYINIICTDNKKGDVCKLILPQILATIKFG